MTEFTIGDRSYKIDSVTIGQYYKIQNLLVSDKMEKAVEVVSELANCSKEELMKLNTAQFNQVWAAVILDLESSQNDSKFYKTFTLNGETFCFTDFDKLTVGEMVDMDILKSDPNRDKLIHTMMAVLYRPCRRNWFKLEAEPYDSDFLTDRAEKFLDLPLKYVYGALNFFLQVPKSLLKVTLDSLVKKAKDKKEKKIYQELSQITSELLGTGTTSSSLSQEMILQKLEKLKQVTYDQLSTTLRTEKTSSEKPKKNVGNLMQRLKIRGNKWQ